MFTIHCHICDEELLVGSRSIVSMHETSDGPIAYVRCPHGHLVVHEFRRRLSRQVDVDAA